MPDVTDTLSVPLRLPAVELPRHRHASPPSRFSDSALPLPESASPHGDHGTQVWRDQAAPPRLHLSRRASFTTTWQWRGERVVAR